MIQKEVNAATRIVIIMSIPLALVTILGYFVMPHKTEYLKEIIGFGLLTVLFIALVILIANKTLKRASLISLLLLSILAFVKLSFYINYNAKISPSALFVIFETNENEAYDYLSGYINLKVIALIVIQILGVGIGSIYLINLEQKNISIKPLYRYLVLIIVSFLIYCMQWKFSNENIVIMAVKSYLDYKEIKTNIDQNLAQPKTDNIKVISTLDIPQTYVIVIGESTTKKHMQLYGYERETNPKLKEIKNELLIFEDVITPNTHTIIALDKILTLSNYSYPNRSKNASIVQLANQADFTTYWISNQQPAGFNESILTQIGRAAQNTYFLNTHDNIYYNTHDNVILPTLEDVLKDKTKKKKVIFIHLMGSHMLYSKRYPKQFNYFKSNNKKLDKQANETINTYDNSIRYNDYIVRDIIEKTRKTNTNSYVLYFSDHGDDVYDSTHSFLGHSEYYGTKPMYTIPFIVWLSDSYKKKFPQMLNDSTIIKRPYILEDFIHSFSDISHISFKGITYEKSIFNTAFKVKKRLIKKNVDYDK